MGIREIFETLEEEWSSDEELKKIRIETDYLNAKNCAEYIYTFPDTEDKNRTEYIVTQSELVIAHIKNYYLNNIKTYIISTLKEIPKNLPEPVREKIYEIQQINSRNVPVKRSNIPDDVCPMCTSKWDGQRCKCGYEAGGMY